MKPFLHSFPRVLFVVLGLGIMTSVELLAEPSDYPPIQKIVESKPLRVGDLEFVTVTEAKWMGVPTDWREGLPIELQLRITNHGEKEVVFPTFDTFSVELTDAAGKKLPWGVFSGRDSTIVTRALAIPAKSSFTLVRPASLRFHEKDKSVYFQYLDGTGMSQTHRLTAGVYQVAFRLRFVPGGHNDGFPTPKPNFWIGEGVTPSATIAYVPSAKSQ